jgi:ketosteroid isomerase-like protein
MLKRVSIISVLIVALGCWLNLQRISHLHPWWLEFPLYVGGFLLCRWCLLRLVKWLGHFFWGGKSDSDSHGGNGKIGLAAVALITPWLLSGQGSPQSEITPKSIKVEAALVKLEEQWNAALIKGDAAFLDALIADDYMDTDPGGVIENKAESLADLRSGDLKYTSMVNDDYKVHAYDDAAVLSYRSTIKGKFKGSDISGQYRMTDMWIKRGGRWLCVAAHQSKLN